MQKVSDRQNQIKELDFLLKCMAMMGDDDTEDFEELMEIRFLLEDVRYVNLREYKTNRFLFSRNLF